jgi:glutaminyl-peptide cyclotransferase
MKIKKHILLPVVVILFIFSCKPGGTNHNGNDNNTNDTNQTVNKINPLKLKLIKNKNDTKIGDIITISIEGTDLNTTDTVQLNINKENIQKLSGASKLFEWDTKTAKAGTNSIDIEFFREGVKYTRQEKVVLLSDVEPEEYTYKVKNTYKHDVKSYTQGLFYYEGYLYEATGLKGESTVRKVKPETGEVLRSFAIPNDIFGEGIVKFEDRIIQLSWESGRGFVYDFETFKLIEEFNYQGEGWGICTDGKYLFMSNGSQQIKILEPQSYTEINSFEVYDQKGPVKYLNELEYINGYIYSNIYQYDKIVKIDPQTGKVLAYIDLSGLLPMNDYTSQTDVLNGIAYDKERNRVFVTGKNWPKLFEVTFIRK